MNDKERLRTEINKLRAEAQQLNELCYKEVGLTPDRDPYGCVEKLIAKNTELRNIIDFQAKAVQEGAKLLSENTELKERLAKSVELPCIREGKYRDSNVYQVVYQTSDTTNTVCTEGFYCRERAKARLKELRGKEK